MQLTLAELSSEKTGGGLSDCHAGKSGAGSGHACGSTDSPAWPSPAASASGTLKTRPQLERAEDSETREPTAAARIRRQLPPGTQPGATATPPAAPPARPVKPASCQPPTGTRNQTAPGTPLPVRGKTP